MQHTATRYIVAALLCLLLAACGGGDEPHDTNPGVQPVNCTLQAEQCR